MIVQGIWLYNNKLSRALPEWSNLSSIVLYVKPGNDGLCGEVSGGLTRRCSAHKWWQGGAEGVKSQPVTLQVPASPQYGYWNSSSGNGSPISTLPQCPSSIGSKSDSTAIIAAAVAGSIVGVVLVGLVGWWCRRQRRHRVIGVHRKAVRQGATLLWG